MPDWVPAMTRESKLAKAKDKTGRSSLILIWRRTETTAQTNLFRLINLTLILLSKPFLIPWVSFVQKSHGGSHDETIAEFARQCAGSPAALGFEAPLFVPIRYKALELISTLNGEGRRPLI